MEPFERQGCILADCGCVNYIGGRIVFCRLHAAAAELLAACRALVTACDSAPPVDFIRHISLACVQAKAAIAKTEVQP